MTHKCRLCGTELENHYSTSGTVWADFDTNRPEPDVVRDVSLMDIGDIALIKTSRYEGQLLLRAFDHFVSLSEPGHTWESDLSGILVAIYPKDCIVSLVRRPK